MSFDPTLLARESMRRLKAYSSARSLALSAKIFLDANESPQDSVDPEFTRFNRYPEPQPKALVENLASIYAVEAAQLCLGRGADEAIENIIKAFCEPGRDAILICPPTYGVYAIQAEIQAVGVDIVPLLADFSLNLAALNEQIKRTRAKVLFLCSPNNPTGNTIPRQALSEILEATREKMLVVVDEAYVEFSDSDSATTLLKDFPQLIVLRTLSKAYAAAALRIGTAIADPRIIGLLHKVRAPYPFSSSQVEAALPLIGEAGQAKMRARVLQAQMERARIFRALREMPSLVSAVYPSQTNFLLARFLDGPKVFARLREQGIVLRDRGTELGLTNCLRLTVGSPEENSILLAALRELV